MKFTPPEICPVCGEAVPRNARACPECGADERSGWKADGHDGLDLPDEDFNYEQFVAEEFGGGRKSRKQILWAIVALVVLVCFLLLLLGR